MSLSFVRTRAGRFAALLFLVSLVAPVSPCGAGAHPRQDIPENRWRPRVEWRPAAKGGAEVLVNGAVVLRFRESRGVFTPLLRAQAAAAVLEVAVSRGLRPGQITVNADDPDAPTVRAGGDVVATALAEPVTAKRRRTRLRLEAAARANARAQAGRWASGIRRALALTPLVVDGAGQIVPVGGRRTLRVRGVARGPVAVYNADGVKKAGAVVDAMKGVITLTGIEPGRETLYVEREGAVRTVSLTVQPYAGTVEVPATITVTGEATPPGLVLRHARLAAEQAARPLPGATLEVGTGKVAAEPMKAGSARTVVVPLRMTGPEMLPVERNAYVSVVNRALPPVGTTALLYSNNPEKVAGPGTLFVGRLPERTVGAARLLYHHQSDTKDNLLFTAELVNDGDAPARVHLVGGDAGPERDTVWVGYRAASDFVAARESGTGVVVEIPAKGRLALSSVRFPAGLTISGLMELRVIAGPAPLVRVMADPWTGLLPVAFVPRPLTGQAVAAAAHPDRQSDHVYANPVRKVEGAYTVGGQWTFLKFGRTPLRSAVEADTVLHGNYGVFYDIAVKMQNPTEHTSTAKVVFEPSAGMAGGIFLIGDRGEKRVEIPQTNMPTETTLATYTLLPGESREVRIRTLPLSGSNYPATIIVRP